MSSEDRIKGHIHLIKWIAIGASILGLTFAITVFDIAIKAARMSPSSIMLAANNSRLVSVTIDGTTEHGLVGSGLELGHPLRPVGIQSRDFILASPERFIGLAILLMIFVMVYVLGIIAVALQYKAMINVYGVATMVMIFASLVAMLSYDRRFNILGALVMINCTITILLFWSIRLREKAEGQKPYVPGNLPQRNDSIGTLYDDPNDWASNYSPSTDAILYSRDMIKCRTPKRNQNRLASQVLPRGPSPSHLATGAVPSSSAVTKPKAIPTIKINSE